MLEEKLDLPDQMSPARLSLDVKVSGKRTIRREVIEVNNAVVVFGDQFFQHAARPRGRDVKHSEQRCGHAPDPMFLAVVFKTRLVAAELRLWGIACLSSS